MTAILQGELGILKLATVMFICSAWFYAFLYTSAINWVTFRRHRIARLLLLVFGWGHVVILVAALIGLRKFMLDTFNSGTAAYMIVSFSGSIAIWMYYLTRKTKATIS